MIYSMDCYFRQSWYDRRLQFQSDIKLLAVSWQFLERVWTPDTYFFNGKESYLHKVTVPNKFVRLGYDGHLMYSMRLTIKASCIMHLRKYPLDSQACPLEIGSFAYSSKDVVFKWKGVKAVDISKDVTLSQYEILKITTANVTSYGPGGEVRSSLMARFILRRRRGYFILQIYAPCSMIVGASWVAFWINRNDAAGRVAVGATTVLTLVTMGFGGRAALPGVNYATALDWFVIMCFTFVFTALVEYACVNYVERFLQHRERAKLAKLAKQEQRQDHNKELKDSDPQNTDGENVRLRLEAAEEEQHRRRSKVYSFWEQILGFQWRRRRRLSSQYRTCVNNEDAMTPSEVSAEVDAWARIIFPVTFTVLKIMYWTMFLYFIDDEIPEDPPTHA
ncbi:gamma-aminobutyric acid receptor subunit alpha-3-like isoform X2 [Ornithodoros turicata]